MATTPRGYPYPALTDSPNEPTQMQNLATAIDTDVSTLPRGYIGSDPTTTAVTLSSTGSFASSAFVAFTVPTGGRRYRIFAQGRFIMSSGTNGQYVLSAAYNSGSTPSIGSATVLSHASRGTVTLNTVVLVTEGDVFLSAGSYAAYAAVQRPGGGGTSDTASEFYIAVYDVGPT